MIAMAISPRMACRRAWLTAPTAANKPEWGWTLPITITTAGPIWPKPIFPMTPITFTTTMATENLPMSRAPRMLVQSAFLFADLGGRPALLRNDSKRGHWIRIKTIGTRSNRDGFGARVELTAGGLTQTGEVRANSSYLSASDRRIHFGLGQAAEVDKIVIHWP